MESVEPSTWLALMDRLSVEYFGAPFPYRQGGDNGVIVRVSMASTGVLIGLFSAPPTWWWSVTCGLGGEATPIPMSPATWWVEVRCR